MINDAKGLLSAMLASRFAQKETHMRRSVKKLVLGLSVVALTVAPLVAGSGGAVAAECKGSYVTYSAKGAYQKSTIAKAVSGWQAEVASSLGNSWSKWSKASSRSTGCDGSAGYWTCWAKAYPCHYSYSGGGSGGSSY